MGAYGESPCPAGDRRTHSSRSEPGKFLPLPNCANVCWASCRPTRQRDPGAPVPGPFEAWRDCRPGRDLHQRHSRAQGCAIPFPAHILPFGIPRERWAAVVHPTACLMDDATLGGLEGPMSGPWPWSSPTTSKDMQGRPAAERAVGRPDQQVIGTVPAMNVTWENLRRLHAENRARRLHRAVHLEMAAAREWSHRTDKRTASLLGSVALTRLESCNVWPERRLHI